MLLSRKPAPDAFCDAAAYLRTTSGLRRQARRSAITSHDPARPRHPPETDRATPWTTPPPAATCRPGSAWAARTLGAPPPQLPAAVDRNADLQYRRLGRPDRPQLAR